MVIFNCKEAIKAIEEHETGKVRRVTTAKMKNEEFARIEKEKDAALAKLISGDFSKR